VIVGVEVCNDDDPIDVVESEVDVFLGLAARPVAFLVLLRRATSRARWQEVNPLILLIIDDSRTNNTNDV